LLIDAEALQYLPSLSVAALISTTLEIYFSHLGSNSDGIKPKQSRSQFKDTPVLMQLQICNKVWDDLVSMIYGPESIKHLDSFGHFLVLRQQKIFRAFDSMNENCDLPNVYKERCRKYYNHKFLNAFTSIEHRNHKSPSPNRN
jgi:hypothetical protein